MNQTLVDECLSGTNLTQDSTDLPLPLIVLLLGHWGATGSDILPNWYLLLQC